MVTTHSEVTVVAVEFFYKLFTSEQTHVQYEEVFRGTHFPQLSTHDQLKMDAPFITVEIQIALKSMHPTKAPGPNGFHANFFPKTMGDSRTIYHYNAFGFFK